MHKDFFVHIIRHKPELFRSILAFNGIDGPRSDQVPVAFRRIPGLDVDALWASGRSRRHLVDGAEADGPERFWDFTEDSRRMALLPPALLERAALQFGVAVHADELCALVAREDVLAMRGEIGADLFAYALRRGRFQLGSSSRLFGSGPERLAERIRRHGRQSLSLCCSVWPRELLDICASRFTELAPAFSAAEAEDGVGASLHDARRAVWIGFKKILLKEVAPQWVPCFD
jgi:hypothetical protein